MLNTNEESLPIDSIKTGNMFHFAFNIFNISPCLTHQVKPSLVFSHRSIPGMGWTHYAARGA
jgi:hypothetical protein